MAQIEALIVVRKTALLEESGEGPSGTSRQYLENEIKVLQAKFGVTKDEEALKNLGVVPHPKPQSRIQARKPAGVTGTKLPLWAKLIATGTVTNFAGL
jgi:hypothetical protein